MNSLNPQDKTFKVSLQLCNAIVCLGLLITPPASSAPAASKGPKTTETRRGPSQQRSQLNSKSPSQKSQDVNFTDHVVKGKFLSANEAVATIENEKMLRALLEERKNFRDRLQLQLKNAESGSRK